MNAIRNILFPVLCGLLTACSQQPRNPILGAYQDCLEKCLTIQLREDHTFAYRLDNDMRSNERFYGTWSELGNKKLHAVIPEPAPVVSEKHIDGESGFQITVVGEHGAPIPGAAVSPVAGPAEAAHQTSHEGLATIPRSEEFEVAFPPRRLRYRPKAADSNAFTVRIQLSAVTLDQVWRIEDDRLYVNDDRWLAKLIPADEQKLFR